MYDKTYYYNNSYSDTTHDSQMTAIARVQNTEEKIPHWVYYEYWCSYNVIVIAAYYFTKSAA